MKAKPSPVTFLLAASVALLSTALPAAAENPRVHALVGARVVAAPDEVYDRAVVVLRDGLVEAVGPDVTPPPDAWIWDLEGRTIYPGLVDAHVPVSKLAAGSGEERGRGGPGRGRGESTEAGGATEGGLSHEISRVRAEHRVAEGLRVAPDKRSAWRNAGITTAHVVPEAGIFRGRSLVIDLGEGDLESQVLVLDGPHHLALESGGWGDREYPSSLMGAVAVARQTLYDARWNRRARRAWERHPRGTERPPASPALDALEGLAHGEEEGVLVARDVLDILRLGRLASEHGLRARIVGNGDEYRRLPEVRELGLPLIVPVDFPETPEAPTEAERLDLSLETLRHWDRAPSNPRWLHDAGITFALTAHGLEEPGELREAVREAIERGLPETAALAALTTVPAEMLGVSEKVGRLAPGLAANLIVTDGPLFGKDTELRAVWVDGERYAEPRPEGEDFEGVYDVELRGSELERPVAARLVLKRKGGALQPPGEAVEEEGDEIEPEARESGEEEADEASEAESAAEGSEEEASPSKARLHDVVLRDTGIVRFSLDPGSWDLPAGRARFEGRARKDRITLRGELVDGSVLNISGERAPDEEERGGEGGEDRREDDAAARAEPPPHEGGPIRTPPVVFVDDAVIWTSGPEGVLEGADLLVRNGRIAAVGAGLAPPRGAEIIEARGRHVTPGLVDAHSHSAIIGGVNEGTHAITSEVRIRDVVNSETPNLYRQLAGGVTTIHLLHGSANPIGGQAAAIKLRWGAPPDDLLLEAAVPTIKFALGENVKQSNWGDEFRTRFPQTRMGVEQFFRERFLEAIDYRAARRDWQRGRSHGLPPRRDLQLDALVEILEGERLVHCHSYRQDEILMLMRVAEELGWTVGTFQHVLEGYKVADEMAAHGAAASTFSDWWAYKFEVYDAIPYNGALMWDRGVLVSFNSDSSELARRMNLEAAKAVKYGGVPPAEALKFVTINPATQIGAEDRIGSLEPGKDADFVLWSGDPLSAASRVEQTWLDGKLYFDRQEDLRRREELAAERRQLLAKVEKAGGKKREGEGGRRRRPPSYLEDEEYHCMPSAGEEVGR